MPVDLHVHTTASDGSLHPHQVVELAVDLHLTAIAISDHDTVAGIDEALAYGATRDIKIIPAIELSSKFHNKDIHVLGFFIDHTDRPLLEALARLRSAREERAERIVACLNSIGVGISYNEVLAVSGQASVGRPHIARVLMNKGYISEFSEAFAKYLKRGAPCFIEKFVYPLETAIELIHGAGGLAVFAHPGLARLDDYISEFVGMGLDGIEAYHTEHSESDTRHYIKLAKRYGLLVTGGSDCHGPSSTHGLRLGTTYVPDRVVDRLEEAVLRRGR